MNLLIIGFILVLAVVGILAVMYITKQASIPDCTNQAGSADGVSKYKLSDDKTACVPDTCMTGFVLSGDGQSCVSSDCSKMDGTTVFVKSYKFDTSKTICVADICTDGTTSKDGTCPILRLTSNVTSPGNNVPLQVPQQLVSDNGLYTAYLYPQGDDLIRIYNSDKKLIYNRGVGTAAPSDTVTLITGDGVLRFARTNGTPVWLVNTGGHTTGDSYQLWMQDDGNLVLYAISNGNSAGDVWSSWNGDKPPN